MTSTFTLLFPLQVVLASNQCQSFNVNHSDVNFEIIAVTNTVKSDFIFNMTSQQSPHHNCNFRKRNITNHHQELNIYFPFLSFCSLEHATFYSQKHGGNLRRRTENNDQTINVNSFRGFPCHQRWFGCKVSSV